MTFPKWCTHTEFDIRINNVQVNTADMTGNLRLLINGVVAATMVYDFNYQANPTRQTMVIGGEYEIPAALRGKTVTCKIQAQSVLNNSSRCRANSSTYTSGHMHHHHKPSYS